MSCVPLPWEGHVTCVPLPWEGHVKCPSAMGGSCRVSLCRGRVMSRVSLCLLADVDEHEWIVVHCHKGVQDGAPLYQWPRDPH